MEASVRGCVCILIWVLVERIERLWWEREEVIVWKVRFDKFKITTLQG